MSNWFVLPIRLEFMIELPKLSPRELLTLHAGVAEELRVRKITRSANNPTGDLAEYLCCKAFGWTQHTNSKAHIDATGNDGARYQIKGRRMTARNKSRQLGAIRDFKGKHFEFLAGVVFTETYGVHRAAIIPYVIIEMHAKFIAHTNSHKFILHDDIWNAEGVRDVTAQLRSVVF